MRPAGRGTKWLVCFAALVLGAFVSLFTAGPALFADGAFEQRPPILLASVVAFALVGLALGSLSPGVWKWAAIGLAISALPVVLVFGRDTIGQVPMMALSGGFMLGDAAGGVLGAWVGALWRFRREARRHGLRS